MAAAVVSAVGPLALGSVIGALLFAWLGLQGLWLAAGWCAALAVGTAGRRSPGRDPTS